MYVAIMAIYAWSSTWKLLSPTLDKIATPNDLKVNTSAISIHFPFQYHQCLFIVQRYHLSFLFTTIVFPHQIHSSLTWFINRICSFTQVSNEMCIMGSCDIGSSDNNKVRKTQCEFSSHLDYLIPLISMYCYTRFMHNLVWNNTQQGMIDMKPTTTTMLYIG